MSRFLRHPWGWTSVAPVLCAVHCIAASVLVAVAPSLTSAAWAEWMLLLVTVLFGQAALRAGHRTHGDVRPVLPVVTGLLAWSAVLGGLLPWFPGEAATAAAALTVAAGLIWNSRLHCRPPNATCPACVESAAEGGTTLKARRLPGTLHESPTASSASQVERAAPTLSHRDGVPESASPSLISAHAGRHERHARRHAS